MTDSILQSFLDNRFIKTDQPEHIANLNKASDEIQKLLKKNKRKIISYTLIALDPTVAGDEPIVREVEASIIKQWATFRNSVDKTKDTPIAYIQAVILDALNKLSKEDNLAAIIWFTGCNVIGHYKLAGQEKVLTDFLLDIGKKIEEVGRKNWSILKNVKIESTEPTKVVLPKVTGGAVDEGKLQAHLKAAAVHSGWASQAGGGENPTHQGNANWQWPKFFAERAAKGLADEINAALSAQSNSLTPLSSAIQKSIDSNLANLQPYLEQVSSSILKSSESLKKRTDLIWWKQALYSGRLDTSYRVLSPLTLAVTMAVDLADNVDSIHPKSVIYFLKETLHDVLGDDADKGVALVELLKQLRQFTDDQKQLLDDLLNNNESRKSLGACMADVIIEQIKDSEFFERTGLEMSSKITLGELTVWLFHDLQANILAKTK